MSSLARISLPRGAGMEFTPAISFAFYIRAIDCINAFACLFNICALRVSANCCYAYAYRHACRNNVLDSMYVGCFLYFVISYTFKFRPDFDCDSCAAMFGASFELCPLFVVDCLAVGWRFWFSRCCKQLCSFSPSCV